MIQFLTYLLSRPDFQHQLKNIVLQLHGGTHQVRLKNTLKEQSYGLWAPDFSLVSN